jgi:hypothetical protein
MLWEVLEVWRETRVNGDEMGWWMVYEEGNASIVSIHYQGVSVCVQFTLLVITDSPCSRGISRALSSPRKTRRGEMEDVCNGARPALIGWRGIIYTTSGRWHGVRVAIIMGVDGICRHKR